jgi:transposase InsO family protein
MSYTSNPHVEKARVEAVRLVKLQGWSKSKVARHVGVNRSTIGRWVAKAPDDLRYNIPTLSSRPKHSPNALSKETVTRIVALRKRYNRCAPIIHKHLTNEGIQVSLVSVKRTLKRQCLTRPRSKWARYRPHTDRPLADAPGTLVQADTIHFIDPATNTRFYLYTIIDVYTRRAHAKLVPRINGQESFKFIREAERYFGFKIQMMQTDNGPEFGRWFGDSLLTKGISLRHSRVRKPNDNAHIERFNRTIQDECVKGDWDYVRLDTKVRKYLRYYNYQRLHLSIGLITPIEKSQMLPRS